MPAVLACTCACQAAIWPVVMTTTNECTRGLVGTRITLARLALGCQQLLADARQLPAWHSLWTLLPYNAAQQRPAAAGCAQTGGAGWAALPGHHNKPWQCKCQYGDESAFSVLTFAGAGM